MQKIKSFFFWLLSFIFSKPPTPPAELAPPPTPPETDKQSVLLPIPHADPAPNRYDLARAQHKEKKPQWDMGKEKEITLREAFIADGAIFYTLADIGDLSRIREAKMSEFINRVAFGITPSYLSEFEPALKKAIEKGDTKRQNSLAMELLSRMRAAPSVLSLCELGALALFRHDENPYTFNPVIHAEKVRLMQMNDEAQFFFAEWAWVVLVVMAQDLQKEEKLWLADKLEGWEISERDDFLDFMEDETLKERTKDKQLPTAKPR